MATAPTPQLPDLVLQEGDEEVQYVLIDLPSAAASDNLKPGAQVTIEGLETDTPKVHLADGMVLQGSYTEQLGTVLLFQHPQATSVQDAVTQGGQGGQAQQGLGTRGAAGAHGNGCKYVGMTETRMVCKALSGGAGKVQRGQEQRPGAAVAGAGADVGMGGGARGGGGAEGPAET